jgi:hypothetical protein
MIGYKNLSDTELRDLLESSALEPYEKQDILNELLDRGSIILDRIESLH